VESIALDNFTVAAEQGYPVGAVVKSKPTIPQPSIQGVVIRNDNGTFDVKWDIVNEVHTYQLTIETDEHYKLCESLLGSLAR
jgi:hypothetical protein